MHIKKPKELPQEEEGKKKSTWFHYLLQFMPGKLIFSKNSVMQQNYVYNVK